MKKIIGLFFCFTLPFLSLEVLSIRVVQDHERYKVFIENLGNDVIQILVNQKEKISHRKRKFRKEIKENFALRSIGRFILARYWRRISKKQQEEYLNLFEDAVIENYASQFEDYNNEKLVILSSHSTKDKGVVIKSNIRGPDQKEPLKIQWKVFNTKRGLKVVDVIVNNISMSITLRNEYAAAIQRRGGIEGLLNYLREKIETDRLKQ